ncbi:hypothetical protein M9434_005653 [Picochlorum sp. BPE23]|nr:hypothetical protein M9434_005653 [Picochlorum sp. BPE23]
MDGRRREYRAVGADYQPGAGTSAWRIGNIAVYLFMAITLIWLSVLTVDRASSVPPLEHNITIPEESKTIKKEEERVPIPVKQPEATTMKKTFIRFQEPGMTFLDAIKTCETFNCLREAHLLPKGNATYNFPHFIIAGYSKSATTSLYRYLNTHPAFMNPKKKEPALFTNRCDFTGKKMFCPPYRVKEYIETILKRDKFVKSGGNVIMFEATPRIFDLGPDLAEILYDLMPWLKLVVSLREPISRSISKYVMFKEKFNKGCFVDKPLDWCLQFSKDPFYGNPQRKYYSRPLGFWLDSFPVQQIKLIQYEELVGEGQARELHSLKEYIGVDPSLTEDALDFGLANCRHCRIHPEGWPMEEKVYRKLIKRVLLDVEELTRLIDKYQLGNGTKWRENWQKIWDDNLARCKQGMCHIQLS